MVSTGPFTYSTRSADPTHRRDEPDATEVVRFDGTLARRTIGVWRSERMAVQVAAIMNQWGSGEMR